MIRRTVLQLALALSAAIFAASGIVADAHAASLTWPTSTFSQPAEARLLDMLNGYRTSSGLKALPIDWGQLHAMAEWRAKDMGDNGYFSHQIPPTGDYVWSFASKYGITWSSWGENIAWNSGFTDPVVTASTGLWNSPEHKANMLGTWTYMAAGAYHAPDGHYIFVEEFVRGPLPGPIATPKPTIAPTAAPRSTPSSMPTARPTVAPTLAPTVRPSATPAAKSTCTGSCNWGNSWVGPIPKGYTPTTVPARTPTNAPSASPASSAATDASASPEATSDASASSSAIVESGSQGNDTPASHRDGIDPLPIGLFLFILTGGGAAIAADRWRRSRRA